VPESSAKKLKCGRRKNEVAGEIDGRKFDTILPKVAEENS
jgi:hypothetical protein